jgi:hypothetical protein
MKALAAPIDNLIHLTNLFRERDSPNWHARLVIPKVDGGKMTPELLEKLDESPQASALTISGLDQGTFELFVQRHAARFSAIYFWKCPAIRDFSPLENLPELTHLAFFWNNKATRLWNLSCTPRLEALEIESFTKLHDLNDLSPGCTLRELSLSAGFSSRLVLSSLQPLGGLSRLERLSLWPTKLVELRVEPLAALGELTHLEFSPKLFTVEQLAWLRCRLDLSVSCDVLAPYRFLNSSIANGDRLLDVRVNGKGKPFLNSAHDAARLQRHVDEFECLVAKFQADPSLLPAAT